MLQYTKPILIRNVNSKSVNREIRIMKKLLEGRAKSKKSWGRNGDSRPSLPTVASLSNPTSQGKSALRRVKVLNKAFMQYVTDFMATDSTISGYGLEISRVNVTTDFKILNVYWLTTGSENDEKLDPILSKYAKPLRHNLSQLRVMGEIPLIRFVKDKTYAKIAEVEALLKHADFGDDFVPTTRPSDMVIGDISGLQPANALPEMTHEVLGLKQAEIMHRIKQNMLKTRQAWERYETKMPTSMEGMFTSGEESK